MSRGLAHIFSLEFLEIFDLGPWSEYDDNINQFMGSIEFRDWQYYIVLPSREEKFKWVQSNIARKLLDKNELTVKGLYDVYIKVFEVQERQRIRELFKSSPESYRHYIWMPHRPMFKNEDTSTSKSFQVFISSFKKEECSITE